MLLAMERPTPLTPLALLVSPPLPSPELLEVMPVLADMSPTLLESSTSPRGPLMPSPRLRLMPTTLEDMVLAMAMVDSMVDTDTGPMVPTARDPLMLSPRLMLMPTTLDMVDSMVDTDMPVSAMVDTPMVPPPTPMVPTMERGPLMPSPRLMLTMELTDMVSPMLDTVMPVLPMVMVPTLMPMVPMPTASKMSSASV